MNESFVSSQLTRRDINRLRNYKELLDFYHGTHWEGYARRGEKRLTFNAAFCYDPSIAAAFDNVHIVWTDERNSSREVYYKNSVDNGENWEPETVISTTYGDER